VEGRGVGSSARLDPSVRDGRLAGDERLGGAAIFLRMTVTPDLIARVAEETRTALSPFDGADWSVPAHDLEWSCRETAVHLADAYFAHAARIVAQPQHWFVPAEITVDDPVEPEQLLEVIGACAELLRWAAIGADPASRAWHPWGTSDPAGSVAMGAAEGLLHTWDICGGLGSDWRPPGELCRPVIDRLFPDAPTDADPTDALLWCSGRAALPNRPRLAKWRWYSSVPD
jgi:hypothetical protein